MFRTGRILLVGLSATAVRTIAGSRRQWRSASSDSPKAIETGVHREGDPHIAVLADVDDALAPGLFKERPTASREPRSTSTQGRRGWHRGPQAVVDFIDTHLNAKDDPQRASSTACQNGTAMVGTFVLFLSNVDDEVNCTDQAAQKTGIPDLASVATGVPQACSPVAFPVSPAQFVCRAKDDNPQTYKTATSSRPSTCRRCAREAARPDDLRQRHQGRPAWRQVLIDAEIQAGIKSDQTLGLSGRDPQSGTRR